MSVLLAPPDHSTRSRHPFARRRERALIYGLRRGEPEALEALHARFGAMVVGYLRHVFRDSGTVDDVFQLVWTEVWRRGESFDPDRGTLGAWVMTITRSRAIDELRRRRPEPVAPAVLPDEGADPDHEAMHEAWRMSRLLALLPPVEAEVLRLRFYAELSQTEIAERLGIALGTVKTRMVRALERLADLMAEEDAR